MLLEYVRDKQGHPIGVVVATGANRIGWSKVNGKLDKFDKNLGIKIAKGRAASGTVTRTPSEVKPYFKKMYYRAQRYFK